MHDDDDSQTRIPEIGEEEPSDLRRQASPRSSAFAMMPADSSGDFPGMVQRVADAIPDVVYLR
ncbi:MAG: hypothetical protein ACRDD1_02660, partial [Planctomycetia bacterium]